MSPQAELADVVDAAPAAGDENADSKASNPKKSLEGEVFFSVLNATADLLLAVVAGAKGSDPNGSLKNASFDVVVAEAAAAATDFDFRTENGSKESSKFSDALVVIGAKGSLNGEEFEGNGSTDADFVVVVVVGQAEAKGSVELKFDNPPDKLNGSAPPPKFDVFPKAVVTGAVNGSSLSWNGSAPEMSNGSP